MFYSLLRQFLFYLPPELAHKLSLKSLLLLDKSGLINPRDDVNTPQTLMGITFPNSVGVAAGLDKNGEYIPALAALGFGFIEIGTVTPKAQAGNPKPRLFRLPQAEALINRMGFNNRGVDYLIAHVKQAKFSGVLGINIGKNAATPLEKAVDDYVYCLEKVYPYASYIAVNISSPNTPGLRQLQTRQDLDKLLQTLKQTQISLAEQHGKYVPLVVKIAPDLNSQEIQDIAQLLLAHQIDGVIATNSTLSREGVAGLKHSEEAGGLSGKPLFAKSLWVVQQLHQHLNHKIPIIACGGISSNADMQKMLATGASLVQIYTGFIYQGPKLIKELIVSASSGRDKN